MMRCRQTELEVGANQHLAGSGITSGVGNLKEKRKANRPEGSHLQLLVWKTKDCLGAPQDGWPS